MYMYILYSVYVLTLLPVLSRQYGTLYMYKLYIYKTYSFYTKRTVVRFIGTLYKTYMACLSLCCTLYIYKLYSLKRRYTYCIYTICILGVRLAEIRFFRPHIVTV